MSLIILKNKNKNKFSFWYVIALLSKTVLINVESLCPMSLLSQASVSIFVNTTYDS